MRGKIYIYIYIYTVLLICYFSCDSKKLSIIWNNYKRIAKLYKNTACFMLIISNEYVAATVCMLIIF